MSSGEPTWYTYMITGSGISNSSTWSGSTVSGAGGSGGFSSNGITWTGGGFEWGGAGAGIRPSEYTMPYKEYTGTDIEEIRKLYDLNKVGIPFKSQVEITKDKLEKIREAMSKFIVVVEIEGVPSAVIPADKISDLYNAIKDIMEK